MEFRARTAAAIEAASAVASELGLGAGDSTVLQDSNRVVLVLQPCGVLARVAEAARGSSMASELRLTNALTTLRAPVGVPEPGIEPKVFLRDGYAITFWKHYERTSHEPIRRGDYAAVLRRLHESLAHVDPEGFSPLSRTAAGVLSLLEPGRLPDLPEGDRLILRHAVERLGERVARSPAPVQVIHGQPHDGNLLQTTDGLLFIDFESARIGPVEFVVADTPAEVAEHYGPLDAELLAICRLMVSAFVSTWCFQLWRHSDAMRWHATTHLDIVKNGLEDLGS